MAKQEEVVFTHVEDPQGKYNTTKCKKGCKHCHGTGVAGKMHFTGNKLVCACVVKRSFEDAKLLQQKII